ncbi:MAG: hypothetical protein SF051_09615 [Elusimicrobiota bacterium]|nr:hypothetical protein [Elusimicrobiota bacterium]
MPSDGHRALLSVEPERHPGSAGFFPDEDGGGHPLPAASLSALNAALSPLYEDLSRALGDAMARELGLDPAACRVLARQAAVPPTHCFGDRLLRLRGALDARSSDSIVLADYGPLPAISRLDDLNAHVCDGAVFNQAVLVMLGECWSLKTETHGLLADATREAAFPNHNFKRLPLLRRVRNRLLAVSSRRWGSVPALAMAYAAIPLRDKALYAPGRLSEQSRPPAWEDAAPDAKLRERVLDSALAPALPALERVLALAGIVEPSARATAVSVFRRFLTKCLPPSLLEAAPERLRACRERLASFAPAPLLFSGGGGEYPAYMLAAARSLGMEVVGCQHGVHYGFTDDFSAVIELELAACDRFITWGWTEFPDHPRCRGLKAAPLPCPWLSEERAALARTWQSVSAAAKPYDVLLVSDKYQRFPPTSSGAGISRNDFARDIALGLEALVTGLNSRGARVLHKPYNHASRRFTRKTITRLESTAGPLYRCRPELDKGLTAELLGQCRLVLWDQPSTGFVECLGAGVPAMVHWPRTYYREAPRARGFFDALEKVGVIHRGVDSLLRAYEDFSASPDAWMRDPARCAAIEAFRREYAWTDADWPAAWKRAVAGLKPRS